MRRLIACFNALLLGMILGMIFLACAHVSSSLRFAEVRTGRIRMSSEVLAETTALLDAATAMHLVNLPAKFCTLIVKRGHEAPSSTIKSAFPARLEITN